MFLTSVGRGSLERAAPYWPQLRMSIFECLVDVIEHDMYFYGYTLEANIPRDLCDFAADVSLLVL